MEKLYETAARLQQHLAGLGVPSAIIGGIAVAIWGTPRFTRDADLKVSFHRDQVQEMLAAIPREYKILHRGLDYLQAHFNPSPRPV